MPEIEMKINPFMVDALVHLIETISGNLESVLPARKHIPENDDMLSEAWSEGLREDQDRDCAALLYLLRDRRFGRSKVPVKDETAESILRACSAVRLKIQDSLLKDLPDHAMETGQIAIQDLEPGQQRGYACYLFLASIQAILIGELNPEIDDL